VFLVTRFREAVPDPQMRSRIVIAALFTILGALIVLSMLVGR
jgi:hypothetical protein